MALDPDMAGLSPSTLHLGLWPELEAALAAGLRRARADDPLRPATVVCGSGAARAYLRRRLIDLAGAHAGVEFVTVHELAGRLGAPPLLAAGRRRLTPPAASRLVRRLTAEQDHGWYFGPVAHTPGLPSALLRSLADLREALVSPGFSTSGDPGGLRALDRLLAGYIARLDAAALYDDALLYQSACDRLKAEGRGEDLGEWVGVYGLYDLPGIQQRLFEAMATSFPLHVFLPWAPSSGYADPARAFFERLCTNVVGGAEEAARDDGEQGCARDLSLVRRSLSGSPGAGSPPASPPSGDDGGGPSHDGSVGFVSCCDPSGERRETARAALAAVHDGVPAFDIAVVHPGLGWRTLAAEQLEALGVPVAGRLPRPTPGQRLLRALLDCLSPAAGVPFQRAAVIEVAAAVAAAGVSPPPPRERSSLGLTAATVAEWDVLASRARIAAGLEQWRLRLASSRLRQSDRLAALKAFIESLAACQEALQRAAAWPELARQLETQLHSLAQLAADEPALTAIRELSVLAAVEPSCSWADVVAVLRETSSDAAGGGRVGRDGVAVVSPHELRGLRFAVVIVAGLTEGVLPPRPRLDPVLVDDDRALVRERTRAHLELSTERPAEAGLLLTLAAAAARRRLVLLHARTDGATGAPRLPSRLLLQAQAAFAARPLPASEADRHGAGEGLVCRTGADGPPGTGGDHSSRVWLSSSEFDWAAANALSRGARTAARSYVDAVLAPSAAKRRATLRSRYLSRLTRWDGLLPRRVATALADELLGSGLSASAVEAYLRCPFTFFARYALGIRPLEEPEDVFELQAGDLGQLVHEVLRRLYGDLAAAGRLSRESCVTALAGVMDEVVGEAEREGLIGFPLAWQAKLRALHRDLQRTVEADPSWTDGLVPSLFEWEFDEGEGAAIDVGGRVLRFRGRIDRLDRAPDGTVVRVIDYKTGRGSRERRRLDKGLDVQLPVYRLVVEALEPAPSRIECAFRMVTRGGGLTSVPLVRDEAESHEALRQVLSVFVEGLAGGVFPRWREQRTPCDSCSFAYGCGADRATAERKRGDPRLAALLAFKEAEA